MKIIFLSLLLFISVNAQPELLTLFADDGVTYSAEATQYFDRLPTSIPDDTLAFYAAFIDSMNGRGYWARVDEMWLLVNKTQANALIGLKGLKDATANGTITFTVYQGMAGNGSNGYINTNFTPSTDGVKYVQNSAMFGVYSRTNSASASADMGVVSSGVYSSIRFRDASNLTNPYINMDVTNSSRANTNSTGLLTVLRPSSAQYGTYRNGGLLVGLNDRNSTGVNSLPFFVMSINNGGSPATYSTREYSFIIFSEAFTAAEQGIIFGFLETLLDNLGAGVIE